MDTAAKTNVHDSESVTSWPEKYRPTTIDELALSEDNRLLIEKYIEGGRFPNLLLHGPPGVGKTTLSRILTPADAYQVLRCDGAKNRSVEYMRETGRVFVITLARFKRKKAFIIDEADGLTPEAQLVLHEVMELRQEACSIILITNRPDKLNDAIKSRCTSISMSEVPVSERERVLRRILDGEGLTADDITIRRFAAHHQDVRAMVAAAQRSYTQYGELRLPPRARGGPRRLGDMLSDPAYNTAFEWDLEPFTAKGCLTLLAGPAKLGKSTFLRHYAAAKTFGLPFLGRNLTAGPVLWVGPDEPWILTKKGFVELPKLPEEVIVWDLLYGPTPSIEEVVAEVASSGVELVILDTLPRVAHVYNENNSGTWNAWADSALPLLRRSGASFMATHHHRKSGGENGDAIRGSVAIFALVDVALSLTRSDHDHRRKLAIDGSRLGLPQAWTIELTDDGYVDLGETDAEQKGEAGFSYRDEILEVLADWLTLREIRQALAEKGIELKDNALRRRLEQLVSEEAVQPDGSGTRGDPFRWVRSN